MEAKDVSKEVVHVEITPFKGSEVDWTGDNEDRIIVEHRHYATDTLKQQQKGPPDFNSIFQFDDY